MLSRKLLVFILITLQTGAQCFSVPTISEETRDSYKRSLRSYGLRRNPTFFQPTQNAYFLANPVEFKSSPTIAMSNTVVGGIRAETEESKESDKSQRGRKITSQSRRSFVSRPSNTQNSSPLTRTKLSSSSELRTLLSYQTPTNPPLGAHVLEEEIWYDREGRIQYIRRKKGPITPLAQEEFELLDVNSTPEHGLSDTPKDITLHEAEPPSIGSRRAPSLTEKTIERLTRDQLKLLNQNVVPRLTLEQVRDKLNTINEGSLTASEIQNLLTQDHRLQHSFNQIPPSPFLLSKKKAREFSPFRRFDIDFSIQPSSGLDKPTVTPAAPATTTEVPPTTTTTSKPLPTLSAVPKQSPQSRTGKQEDHHFLTRGLPKSAQEDLAKKIQPILDGIKSAEQKRSGSVRRLQENSKKFTQRLMAHFEPILTKAKARLEPVIKGPGSPQASIDDSSFDLDRLWVRRTPTDQEKEEEYIKPVRACVDEHSYCLFWSTINECNKNPLFMTVYCCASCATRKPVNKKKA